MARLILVCVAACVSVAAAAPIPKALRRPGDARHIVGVWAPATNPRSFWVFREDGTGGVGDADNPALKAVYRLDPHQKPKHLDWSQDSGKTWYLGVYELDGDHLRISFGRGGGSTERPPSVDPANGFQFVSVTRWVQKK